MKMPKNLKDMAASKDVAGVKKTDLYKVDPRLIKEEDGFNIRQYDTEEVAAHIESLTEAMLNGAYIPPIVVRPDGTGNIFLIDGHCRHKAALKAIERGAEGLMLTAVNFRGSDTERIELMLRSGEGLKFTPLEVAKGYLRLKRMNISTAEIAKRMGKSVSHIEQYLTLATSNHDVQQMVEKGEVSATVAIQVVRKEGENAGEKLKQAKTESGGKKVTAKVVKLKKPKPKPDVVMNHVKRVFDVFEKLAVTKTESGVVISADEWHEVAALMDAYEEYISQKGDKNESA